MATRSLKGSVGIFEILKVIRKHKKVKKPCLSGSVMMGYICVTCRRNESHRSGGRPCLFLSSISEGFWPNFLIGLLMPSQKFLVEFHSPRQVWVHGKRGGSGMKCSWKDRTNWSRKLAFTNYYYSRYFKGKYSWSCDYVSGTKPTIKLRPYLSLYNFLIYFVTFFIQSWGLGQLPLCPPFRLHLYYCTQRFVVKNMWLVNVVFSLYWQQGGR